MFYILDTMSLIDVCTNASYMSPYNSSSPLHISIIKLKFHDKHEPRSIQIIGMEKNRAKQ
jgi:hypothetical protein